MIRLNKKHSNGLKNELEVITRQVLMTWYLIEKICMLSIESDSKGLLKLMLTNFKAQKLKYSDVRFLPRCASYLLHTKKWRIHKVRLLQLQLLRILELLTY